MTLPSAPPISASQINVELGRAPDAPFSITGAEERALAGKPTGPISFSDFLALFTSVAVVGSNAATITIPADSQAGDLAVMYDFAVGTLSAPPTVTPPGWTAVTNNGNGDTRGITSYRILTGGDPGDTITGMNGDDINRKVMRVLRGRQPVTTATSGGWDGNITVVANSPGNISVPASGGSTPLVVLGFAASRGTVNTFSSSPAFDSANAASATRTGYKSYKGTASNHTVSMTQAGDRNGLAAGYFQISF
ncbi:hypothetical protein [Mesorhizobium sp. YR577]|uniref:hypothetical protein n=1 Tax=Mesorhizobium sp. YR577 TaxID=1884373 RepID=UPI0008EF3D08|nr:hypothetical protein [Mesorhizobium sp. YR577]SFU21020.1 hypothetical protein SAMN05518861_12537 [Mesorhizobium sp. YR577]